MPEATGVAVDEAEAIRLQQLILARMVAAAPLNADGYAVDGRTDNLMAVVDGKFRTSQVVDPPDGRLPYRPDARPAPFRPPPPPDGHEVVPAPARCLASGGPLILLPSEFIRTIVQTPENFVVVSEAPPDARIFRIGGRHNPDAVRSRMGDSIAWWEGDTLVVETTQVRSEGSLRIVPGSTPLVMREQAPLIERFTLVAPDEILYQYTVDDPDVYTRPWMAEFPLVRTTGRQFEVSCHEGNYALPNILRGAREQEKQGMHAPSSR
jgi:hypothetical protein